MGLRDTMRNAAGRLTGRDAARELFGRLAVRLDALENGQAQLGALGQRVTAIEAKSPALEDEVAGLKKKLGMAMGAVQATTAQLQDLKKLVEQASAAAKQASQQATTAQATAESAAAGVEDLERRLPTPEAQ